jgi:hypothetical protein
MGDEIDPAHLIKGDLVCVSVPKMNPLLTEDIVYEVIVSREWRGVDWYVRVKAVKRLSGEIITNQERNSIDFAKDLYRSTTTFHRAV